MERNNLEDLIIDRRIMLKGMLKKYHGSAWTGLIWLRTGTSGRLLWTQLQAFRFYQMRIIT